MSDDPFAEPNDSDRTVIRPAPGGRRAPSPVAAAPPPPPAAGARPSAFEGAPMAAAAVGGAETIQFGLNPLINAAAPLLQLLGRLRMTVSAPNADDLRDRTVREVRQFEAAAREGGVPNELLQPAHYALCASIDDIALNTPWGSTGGWAARSLVATFHQEVRAGERFFQILEKMKEIPATNLPVLELMYYCLSLGFLGQYRRPPHRPGEIDRIREDLYTMISRQRQVTDTALSPHWQGVQMPYKPAGGTVPTWVMAAAALGIVGGVFIWFSTSLNGASDDTFSNMLTAPLSKMPAIVRVAPVRPPEVVPLPPEPIYVFLKPEIDQGLVTVLGDKSMPIVRIRNKGMFASGSATVNQGYYRLLERIGEALRVEKGPVQVIGYTDNQPIRTVRFPSNYQLSAARAEAARDLIVRQLGEPGRINAVGKADADPLASNATEAGRDENRRIEVVLRRQG
ncbi:MAG: type VI secretion system protein TssL [Acetobacteraceae bacterium]|nr:type VI secretion system protein TssL [Acetobacteraceae bacterium]